MIISNEHLLERMKVRKEANRLGWSIVTSQLKGDEVVVICKRHLNHLPNNESYHVSNYYNGSFFNGRYDLSLNKAIQVFDERLNS